MTEKKKVRKKKFFSTVQLEKELLHILLNDIFSLRRFHSRINKDWFSDDCREEIFDILLNHFQFYNVCLNKEIFTFELEKRYGKDGDSEENSKKKKELITEFDNDISLKNNNTIGMTALTSPIVAVYCHSTVERVISLPYYTALARMMASLLWLHKPVMIKIVPPQRLCMANALPILLTAILLRTAIRCAYSPTTFPTATDWVFFQPVLRFPLVQWNWTI